MRAVGAGVGETGPRAGAQMEIVNEEKQGRGLKYYVNNSRENTLSTASHSMPRRL